MDASMGANRLFAGLTVVERAELRETFRLVTLDRGHRVFEAGEHCKSYVLVRSGQVRVHQLDAEGREVVLYRLGPGDTCILNTAALLADQAYAAYAIVETAVEADTISVSNFNALVANSPGFRAFVFGSHAARIGDLMIVIRDLAFEKIDARLARCLLALADTDGRLGITHADLASELGTAREVISRHLKTFERKGWVKLQKSEVMVIEPVALAALGHVDDKRLVGPQCGTPE